MTEPKEERFTEEMMEKAALEYNLKPKPIKSLIHKDGYDNAIPCSVCGDYGDDVMLTEMFGAKLCGACKPATSAWMPIEDAPEETWLLLYNEATARIDIGGFFLFKGLQRWRKSGHDPLNYIPTHYALITPPEVTK